VYDLIPPAHRISRGLLALSLLVVLVVGIGAAVHWGLFEWLFDAGRDAVLRARHLALPFAR
jgi:hypothetical protein